jgi:hypothetical protein
MLRILLPPHLREASEWIASCKYWRSAEDPSIQTPQPAQLSSGPGIAIGYSLSSLFTAFPNDTFTSFRMTHAQLIYEQKTVDATVNYPSTPKKVT